MYYSKSTTVFKRWHDWYDSKMIFAIVMIVKAVVFKNQTIGLDVKDVSSYAIVLGVLIGIIAFFGCCGAIKESPCMLTIYAGIVLTLFILQIILGILAFVAIAEGEQGIKTEAATHLMEIYKNRNNSKDMQTIDDLQSSLECCGVNGPNGTEVAINSTIIMNSCCNSTIIEKYKVCTIGHAYQDSCSEGDYATCDGKSFRPGNNCDFLRSN
ncbi:hypothetical protein NQ318_014569 [Aromia moschata]|uniref:Tetraspanin n=1 Tax=Aromia moschata TaxID=1265417 RepID=A0AAV8XYF1_9CUCU|nr:hypothetical protein NQ318_014569 [Aromia moschata]